METGTQGPADIGNLPTSSLNRIALARVGFHVGARLRSLQNYGPFLASSHVFVSMNAIEFSPQR